MTNEEYINLSRTSESLRRSLSVPVMLDYEEAQKIIISDLVAKYKSNVDRGEAEWAEVFRKTLSYYVDSKELKTLLS